jgi:glutamate-1-semialdehyde 2,1-aminomutase
MLKNEKSQALSDRFNEYYPGGHSNFRVPMAVTEHRLFIERAQGSHLWDVDGNEYIEFNGAMGPSFLGHRHPQWIADLKDVLDTSSTSFGSNLLFSSDDVKVAELLTKYVPCIEQIKFCVTGSEAVQLAIRIGRAYTGKTRIVRFEKHYHGWLDNVFGGQVNPDASVMPNPYQMENTKAAEDTCRSEGKSPWAKEETLLIPWNDFDRLEETFKRYHDEIAMIHFEQIVCNCFNLYPKPGFIEKIRELCDKYNVVMSVDEVITGFRLGLGGAQAYLGTDADICTMGKALAGGLPVSLVGGKKRFMELLKDARVLGPGTFNGYGLGQRAVLSCLRILGENDGAVYARVAEVQNCIMNGLVALADKFGIPLTITHAPGVFCTLFGIPGGIRKLYTKSETAGYNGEMTNKFQTLMQEEGIFLLLGSRWYMNISHTMEDAKKALAGAEIAMSRLQ